MAKVIQCFMLDPTDQQVVHLRRYAGRREPGARCPSSSTGYHNAMVEIDRGPWADEAIADSHPHDDPRWPKTCACGYVFADTDHWQRFVQRLYRRSDTGGLETLHRPPPGAMWYADWTSMRGPDGRCLFVQTPAGPWSPDQPSSDGRPWTRTGTPPNVTATPSIGLVNPDGTGWAYHGWLRDGQLVEC
ncbi:MAG: hypothetical protein GWN84_20620 [Gammaproteobacteria bacterium]|nr:hypothetical protein [Gammaproteobacteria bacterium]NIR85166.1 hypothetical protein [Gammaproteobacteria bacterium]NIU06215.1 hypothetical protein [Gammaproteobacteria bacterium]NIX87488.1 hypothetical protein [Gammaproteobacteria bacterium]